MTVICVFGDSIVYGECDREGGWVSRLRRYLDDRVLSGKDEYNMVYNLGVSGDKSGDLLERFDSEIRARVDESDRQSGLIIIFAVGVNDSGTIASKNRVGFEEFSSGIETLLKKGRALTKNVIFSGILPVDEAKTSPVPWKTELSYDNASIERYNKAIKGICAKNNALFMDASSAFGKEYKNLLEDGLHPNSEGHELIYRTVRDFLVKEKLIR